MNYEPRFGGCEMGTRPRTIDEESNDDADSDGMTRNQRTLEFLTPKGFDLRHAEPESESKFHEPI